MKIMRLWGCVLLGLLVSVTASSRSIKKMNFVGNYWEEIEVPMLSYEKSDCIGRSFARWVEQDNGLGYCSISTYNEVGVLLEGGVYKLSVEVVGFNARTCSYYAEATEMSYRELVSRTDVVVWQDNKFVPATCELIVNFEDEDTVSVRNNGNCYDYCGAGVNLEVKAAKRMR